MTDHHQGTIRPVNIETDLASLADLIELVFHERMDDSGRAAIREMRYMSRLGIGLRIFGQLNDLIVGISQGFVWIEDGKLVGNVSLYPARLPGTDNRAWLIANVGTHPAYRQRGIARLLMERSLQFLHEEKGASQVLLQVDYDNTHAIELYKSLGFRQERAFTRWTRSSLIAAPPFKRDFEHFFISRPRRHDWQAEFELATETRDNHRGGIGWLKPLREETFRPTVWKSLRGLFALTSTRKLIIRDAHTDDDQLLASLWIERGMVLRRTQLTLMRRIQHGILAAEALLVNALRLYNTGGFLLEHPHDDEAISALLTSYRFRPHRTVWHMRYRFE